ncbi:polyprotein, partial [Tulip breaking virus]
IIENGVTLDIDVVVDFGTKVVPELDIDTRLIRYAKNSVSFGERIQRLGRVGRNKDGVALRIGHTEKGLVAVPAMTATEAAFLCFAHGLPVMTNGVSTNLLANCTVPQARVMMQFELNPFYTVNFVRFDGSMHPMIHKLLVPYKLRDSEIILNKMAIPNQSVSTWATAKEYAFQGMKMSIPDDVRIPFHSREIPDRLHEAIWGVVMKHKGDAGFGRVSSASACKIAYTLQTDLSAIQRTVQILEKLIENELKKQAYFKNITSASCSSSFSLVSIANAIRSRHIADHTTENISILQAAKNQLMEFRNISVDLDFPTRIEPFGALECVQFQSVEGVSKQLGLKGHWNSSVVTQDLIVCGAVIAGGFWMLCAHFQGKMSELVSFQAKNKRQRQKLRFREARDNKFAREVYGEDSDMAHYFGTAYTAKGKTKGTTRGMGAKTRRFINMYNFDPTEYSFARYIDPLTGYTLDEQAIVDLNMVQDHFGTIRAQLIDNDLLDRQTIKNKPGIEAYFVKDLAKQILKVDLTPHNPTRVCDKSVTIAGFPDRENELRQTNAPVMLPASALPKENPYEDESVDFEHKSTFHGVRDYNPIAVNICCLENISDGYSSKIFGIGFGSVIITNQHLFSRNNGTLTIQSHHGIYHIKNTTQLNLFPIKERDIVLIQLPKDFPPFSQKLKFRQPMSNEKVCLVGTNFQEKSTTSTVSESSIISQKNGSHFYRHWISTKDGQCGLPAVAAKDGAILGIHSLTSLANDSNFFIAFPENFHEDYLSKITDLDWIKHWKLNVNTISWGSLSLEQGKPDNLFRLSKDITALDVEPVQMQSKENQWLYSQLQGNLKAVAKTTNQLVTKHVVKGKCMLFETYLQVDKEAERYFRPLMGAYQKSRLNREAYVKDLFKYALPITVGAVDCDKFEMALDSVVSMMERAGFDTCNFVTDESEIFSALNMKAAVGALYSGKKRDYFQNFTDEEKEQIVRDSCYRLFQGKMGVWNGSLKAELRPVEKVAQNKTRSFTAAPLDTLLGGKVCVDDFNNKFYSFNLKCPWSVGMTKFYKGWNTLLTSLPDGWIYCDADGSQFDSSLSPYLINAVLNLRLHFMEDCPFGETMLKNLYTEIIYTTIATPDGTIVKKFKGNNSGQPSTVVDNTL